jgi:hypothetical protein
MAVAISESNAGIEFNSLDEDFFTLDLRSHEVIFAVSKDFNFLSRPNGSPKFLKRLLELADKIDFHCYALVDHARKCCDTSLPDEPSSTMFMCSFSAADAAVSFHPSQRQKEMCFFSKCLLAHASQCKNKCCPVDYCQVFRDVLEYQFLFARL